MPRTKTETAVLEMATLLVDEPVTATAIARKINVSKPTAYAYLEELRARLPGLGLRLKTSRVREGKKGPLSRAYQVEPATSAA